VISSGGNHESSVLRLRPIGFISLLFLAFSIADFVVFVRSGDGIRGFGWYWCKLFHKIQPLREWYMPQFDIGHRWAYFWKCGTCSREWPMRDKEKKEHFPEKGEKG